MIHSAKEKSYNLKRLEFMEFIEFVELE